MLYASIVCIGDISSFALNPVVTTGLDTIKYFWDLTYTTCRVIAEFTGAVTGAIL